MQKLNLDDLHWKNEALGYISRHFDGLLMVSPSGDNSSDLWISLDDAVSYTGVSRRSVLEWIRSGQVKREKRQGQVYVWVADLAAITPLTRPEPEIQTSKAELLSPSFLEGYSSVASIKAVGERLKENMQLQEKILGRLDEVQNAVAKFSTPSSEPLLDERTIKELSLLGNVFRSLHQQNEKVAKSLDGQEALLKKIDSTVNKEDSWTQRWLNSEKRLGRWRLVTVSTIVLGLAMGLLVWQHIERERENLHNQIRKTDVEKLELLENIATKEKSLLEKDQAMQQAEREHKIRLAEEATQVEQKMLMEMNAREKLLQKEISEKEALLALLKEKENERLKQIDTLHREELSRMEKNQAQTIATLSEGIDALKIQMQKFNTDAPKGP